MDHFGVTIDSSDGLALVHPRGELDVASASTLRTALARLLGGDHRRLVMDLSRVGTEVELRAAGPAVRRVLDLTGLGTPATLA